MQVSSNRLSAALAFCEGRANSRVPKSEYGTHWRVSVYRSSYDESPLLVRLTDINIRQSNGLGRLSGTGYLYKSERLFLGKVVETTFGKF